MAEDDRHIKVIAELQRKIDAFEREWWTEDPYHDASLILTLLMQDFQTLLRTYDVDDPKMIAFKNLIKTTIEVYSKSLYNQR